MMTIDDILRLLKGASRSSRSNASGPNSTSPPLTPGSSNAALHGAQHALAPKQSDESRLIIQQFGPDGGILQHREEWAHEQSGLKAVTTEVKVATCTGELVEPKQVRVVCLVCGGHDSVVAHCPCGVALCRRCVRRDPNDGSPLCPVHYHVALDRFNTWAARDRQGSKEDPR